MWDAWLTGIHVTTIHIIPTHRRSIIFSLKKALHTMLLNTFYKSFHDPLGSYHLLREYGLAMSPEDLGPCERCGSDKGFVVALQSRGTDKEKTPKFRCKNKPCRTWLSIRTGNPFFYYRNSNGRMQARLPVHCILELVYMFIVDLPFTWVQTLTGRCTQSINDWFNMCREVCSSIVEARGQMVGTLDNPIEIDESRFAGKRKYRRGRLLQGDRRPRLRNRAAVVFNNRNHGNRVDGPWVFGLIQGNDVRYFWVERRDRQTLLPIIQQHCAPGSHITSDEWKAYECLSQHGFVHKTVCHQRNYVNPEDGAHTQTIERSWLDAKVRILKKMRGVPPQHFQSHLNYYCWKKQRQNEPCLFTAFLRDIATVYVNA